MKLTTFAYLLSRFRMSGAFPLLGPCAIMAWTGATVHLKVYLVVSSLHLHVPWGSVTDILYGYMRHVVTVNVHVTPCGYHGGSVHIVPPFGEIFCTASTDSKLAAS